MKFASLPLAVLLLAGCGAPIPPPAPNTLASADCNHDGTLDRTELNAFHVYDRSGIFGGSGNARKFSAAEVAAADASKDGKIDYPELVELTNKAPAGWGFQRDCR